MSACFDTIRVLVRRYKSELIKTTGDGALLLFEEPVEAVRFGLEFNKVVARLQLGDDDPAKFRVGIHHGEVVLQDGDAFGHAVNVAARIETQAVPGGCIVSQAVRLLLNKCTDYTFEPVGAPALKNISERIPIFRVVDSELPQAISPLSIPILQTVGGVQFSRDERMVPLALGKKQLGILGYLALCNGHSETFDRLISLIWPDKNRSSAKRLLWESLQRIDKSLPVELSRAVSRESNSISLDNTHLRTDLDNVKSSIRRGVVPKLLYIDPDWSNKILVGLDGLSPLYDSWLHVSREECRMRVLSLLQHLIENIAPATTEASNAADAVLLLEPGNEIASSVRIRNLAAQGNREGALTEFDRLRLHLSSRYNIGPSEIVLSAIQSVRSQFVQSLSASPALRSRPRRLLRIGLAQFSDETGNSDHRCAAFREDLLTNLTRIREWSVLDSKHLTEPDGGESTRSPDYRIEGTPVSQSGDIGLSITLRDCASLRIIWSDQVSVSIEKWTERQRILIAKIAATIDSYVSADRLSRVIPDSIGELTSHDEWLRGNQLFMRWAPEEAETARQIFEEIIAIDAGYAPAYSSLAGIYMVEHVIWPGRLRTRKTSLKAERLASKAVELDPMDARNHRAMAWAAAMNGSFDRASLHLDLCMSLNPNSPANLSSCAMGYAWLGDGRKAEAVINRLLTISRNLAGWMWGYLASSYFFLGQMEDALEAAELSGDAIVDNQGWTAAILAHMGREEEAAAAFQRLVIDVSPNWVGEDVVGNESVLEWLSSSYPIRRDKDRAALVDSLRLAAL